jgi:hypothetical protein
MSRSLYLIPLPDFILLQKLDVSLSTSSKPSAAKSEFPYPLLDSRVNVDVLAVAAFLGHSPTLTAPAIIVNLRHWWSYHGLKLALQFHPNRSLM